MISIVRNKIFDELPEKLTEKVINKYFDHLCKACKTATLSQKPIPSESSRDYDAGECASLDIKHWEQSDFSDHKFSLHALDLGSEHSETYLLTGMTNLIDFVKLIVESWYSAGHIMKEMRIDAQFVTAEIKAFLKKQKIEITQPAPHEHGQNGSVEVLIKHMQEDVNKLLLSSELSHEYWGLAVLNATDLREWLPSSKNPLVSRAVAWGKPKGNLKNSPLIPFGSRVLAHLPLKKQTALSGRAFPAVAVGRAPGVKGGIKLFNPKTKRVIIRRTFKVLGLVDRRKSSKPGFIISKSLVRVGSMSSIMMQVRTKLVEFR